MQTIKLKPNQTHAQLARGRQTPVANADGEAVANKIGATYLECSAKDYVGVVEVFQAAIKAAKSKKEQSGGYFEKINSWCCLWWCCRVGAVHPVTSVYN